MSMNPRDKKYWTEKKLRASYMMASTIQVKLFNETPDTIHAMDLFQITHKPALK